ncbi:MAG TPA: hypothetical protein PKC13_18300, partial [Blastocatellia bacterium]|nr:hypothetical protein [Blastocatellia bacterium]
MPTAAAIDPQGRGFYVIDEAKGASLLRFVNTTNAPVTLAGVTIPPGEINLIAGGGIAAEAASLREVDLTQVTGMTVDPTGDVVYITTPILSAIRAINVGTQNFSILRQTIPPATIKTIFNISRSDFGAITMSPSANTPRQFFYIGSAQFGSARLVYKLDPEANLGSGDETVYAGGGSPLSGNGDGQLATQARLISPMDLAIDVNGNLLIAEGGDTRLNPGAIRKVDASGFISSVATGLEFPIGVAAGPLGSVYVLLANAQQLVRISIGGTRTLIAGTASPAACDQNTTPTCGDGGPAISANLNLPGSNQLKNIRMAVVQNGIYLPDFTFRRVRYINTGGGQANIAGTIINTGQINTVAGSGQTSPYDNIPATNTELQNPTGVAVDANGNLFIADTNADPFGSIRFVNRGDVPITLFGNTASEITVQPSHIATLNSQAGTPANDERIATAYFASPQGLAVTSKGVFIVDAQDGALVRPLGSLNGRRSGHIRFLNTSSSDVVMFPNGGTAKVVIPPGFIRDLVGRNDQPAPGSPTADDGPANLSIVFPTDVAVDAAGNLYIADQGNNRIRKVNALTGFVTSLMVPGTEGLVPLTTGNACGLAVTPGGQVYIADTKNDRILRQNNPNSTAFTIIANASQGINKPRDLTVDAAGNVFVTNSGTDRILRVVAPTNTLGIVSAVAGNGQPGFSGDGGPSILARLNLSNPEFISASVQSTANIITLADGNFLFADTENNRVRLLVQHPNQTPVLAAVADVSLDENQTQTINFSATDGNNDPLTLSAQNVPAFATFTDNGNGGATMQLAPGFTHAGAYTVTVIVNDGDATDSKSFTITVRDVNRQPTVSVTPVNPTIYEATGPTGRSISLTATATDPDNDPLTYQWFDGAAQIAATLSPQVTLGIGTHSIFLTVTDSKGLSVTSPAQTLIVRDTTAPVISGVPADITTQAITDEGAAVTYTLPTALDLVDGAVTVTTDKASGSVFVVGVT